MYSRKDFMKMIIISPVQDRIVRYIEVIKHMTFMIMYVIKKLDSSFYIILINLNVNLSIIFG